MFIKTSRAVQTEITEQGGFLRVSAEDKRTELGQLEADRAVFLYRCNACFTDAVALENFEVIPSDTVFLIAQRGEKYFLMYMLDDGKCSYSLSGEGGTLYIERAGEYSEKSGSLAVYFLEGKNIYRMIETAAAELSRHFPWLKTLKQKKRSDFLGKLGFCTYNAFYDDISDEKITEIFESGRQNGVKFGFLIIDSGWMCGEDGKMNSFDPDSNKFPQGFLAFSEKLKHEYGLRSVYLWHTIYGFWTGIGQQLGFGVEKRIFNESNCQAKEQSERVIGGINTAGEDFYPLNITGQVCTFPVGKELNDFYRKFYEYLSKNGIDGTKLDAISWLELFGAGNGGQVKIMEDYMRAIEKNGKKYFQGNILCCSGESVDFLLHSGELSLIRVCKDYMPDNVSTFGPHIYYAAINSLWMGEFFYCDYDMFQSGGRGGRMHAINRAISGGPVYCSDNLNTIDYQILRSLAAEDGSVPVCDSYAKPTLRSLFINIFTDEKLFMQFNSLGENYAMAVYNCTLRESGRKISDSFCISEIEIASAADTEKFLVYSSERGFMGIYGLQDAISVELGFLEAELFSVVPLRENSCAWIGKEGKILPFGFVDAQWDNDVYCVNVKESGTYLLYSEEEIEQSGVLFRKEGDNLYKFFVGKERKFSIGFARRAPFNCQKILKGDAEKVEKKFGRQSEAF